jgi:hypothetical protein
MATIDLRQSVLAYVKNADNRFLKLVNALAESYQEDEQEDFVLNEKQYKIIDKRRESHLQEKSQSFTWEQVKQNARNAAK